jgi:AbiV family abortive infection protein
MNQNFVTISRRECTECVSYIEKNAEEHYEIGKLLSAKGYNGSALSHLILSSEEKVKAFIIALAGVGVPIRSAKGIKLFFTDHKPRHSFSAIAGIMIPFLTIIKGFIESVKQDVSNLDKSSSKLEELSKMEKEESFRHMNAFLSDNDYPTIEKIIAYTDFWSSADLEKQKGFYVDYRDSLHTPQGITLTQYAFVLECVDFINTQIDTMIRAIINVSDSDRSQISKMFNENPMYKQFLEDTIADLTKRDY